jgi:hypothetical protein
MFKSLNKDDKELFKDVVFLVEATSTEQHFLWQQYSLEYKDLYPGIKDPPNTIRLDWSSESIGKIVTIGSIETYSVNVSIFYAKLNGKRVLFYEGISLVVHHGMIEDWLAHWTKEFIRYDNGHRWAHTDAMNFHHCLHAILDGEV